MEPVPSPFNPFFPMISTLIPLASAGLSSVTPSHSTSMASTREGHVVFSAEALPLPFQEMLYTGAG